MNENTKNDNSAEFDKKSEIWYNNNKDEQGVVRINLKNAPRLNDPKCNHNWYIDEADGDSSWAIVWKCSKCPIGKLVNK